MEVFVKDKFYKVSVEKISRRNLTKEQASLLDETLDDIRNSRNDRLISLEELKKQVGG